MDEFLVSTLYDFGQILMVMLGALIVPISINPWMIIPLLLIGVLFFFLQKYFIPTGREMKRLDNIGK